jgi:multiple sugar transport system substrate-binding protein
MVSYPIYLPDYSSIRSKLEPEFQNVLLGRKTVEEFIELWATLFEKAKAEYDKNVKK